MVELNHRQRTIKVKIVYYGPPVGGKTTNLQVLHQNVIPGRRGEMVSIASAQDRTILFDMLPVKASGFRGFDLRLQVLAVPGQAMYAATRRLVLRGADAIVFVANSAADRWEENVQSLREMTENLLAQQLDPASLPLALQYNKRDLPQVTPVDFMDRFLNARGVTSIPAVAIRGEGVLETFSCILAATIEDLASRYQIADVTKGQRLDQWTKQTILGMFGTTSLTPNAPAEETEEPRAAVFFPPKAEELPPQDRRSVRIALPEDAVQMAGVGPSARGNEALVESYAEASTRLTADLADMREDRDRARRRLEQLDLTLNTVSDLIMGQPVDGALRGVLGAMAEAGSARHASFLLPTTAHSFRAAALRGLTEDPLLKARGGVRHVLERFVNDVEPRIHQAADSLDLGEALDDPVRPFLALVAIPVRTSGRLQGLALLYYTPDDALPTSDDLAHLASLAGALSAGLELIAARETARDAEQALHIAAVGTLSLRGLEEILASMLALRDRLAEIRRHVEATPELRDDFGRITPDLAGALSVARSLLTFGRHQVQREMVDIGDLLAELRKGGTLVELRPEIGAVLGDPHLIRLGLLVLLDHLRNEAAPPEVHGLSEGGRVKIRIVGPPGAEASGSGAKLAAKAHPALAMALVESIVELHGGSMTSGEDDKSRPFLTLTLPSA